MNLLFNEKSPLWNSTAEDYPKTKCVHQLFEERVEQNPEAIALVFNEEKLTYRKLNERANQIADELRSLETGPGVLVGIFVDRSIEMVAGLLGILKTGAAYVPLDPAFPSERLAHMISDATMPVILTQQKLIDSLPPSSARIIAVDSLDNISSAFSKNVSVAVTSENLAYVIYTSGSTGKPKGVQITHRAVINLLTSIGRLTGFSARDNFLAVSTFSFDISVLEIFLSLITGAQVTIASRAIAVDGKRLAALIESSAATFLQATPATWRLLVESGWTGNARLIIFCGGEALERTLADQLLKRIKTVWNLYGPTETTIYSTGEKISPGEEAILIGRPLSNTQTYILDEKLQPVPLGEVGELHIGGDGLARGYLNRPELTDEKFIPNPFAHECENRIYKTGDLARFLADGRIQCLGRIDHQVKIRGYRIELGEIESALQRFPTIQQAVVMAREDHPGEKRLVAYLKTSDASMPPVSEMRKSLQTLLPDYMIPSAYVLQDKFPQTPNGKIDRKSLPVPLPHDTELIDNYVAPQTPLESDLASIWSEVFQLSQVGVEDNFFDLGGHSLTAVQVLVRIREKTGVELPLQTLFAAPTIRQLAAAILEKLLADDDNEELSSALKSLNQISDEEARELLSSGQK